MSCLTNYQQGVLIVTIIIGMITTYALGIYWGYKLKQQLTNSEEKE